MKKNNIKGCLILAVTALIWGTAFIAQRTGTEFVGPFTFTFCRSLLAAVVLLPVSLFLGRGKKKEGLPLLGFGQKNLITAGVLAGVFLFAATSFQQTGIQYTTSGKSAFITAMYMIIAPLIGMLFGKRPGLNVWAGIAVGAGGMYLLCMGGESGMGKGDLLTLVCAFLFALQILAIDRYSGEVDCIKMSFIQFAVCTLLSLPFMFIFETPQMSAIADCAFPLLYTGVLSSAVAYTLQIIGQKYADMTTATLTMSLESVFAAIAGWLILKETMGVREIVGCVLIFAAIVVSQLNPGKKAGAQELPLRRKR